MLKYEYIARDLIDRINKKEFKSDKLPTENELVEDYSVSKNTIRNAITVLKNEGIIFPIQGSGYYIHYVDSSATFLGGLKGLTFNHPGSAIVTKLLELQQIPCDEEISQIMKCEIGTPLYFLKRLRMIDNKPYSLEYTYYNKNIVPYLDKELAESSIYRYLNEDLKLSFSFTDKYVSACALTNEEGELLALAPGSPGFVIEDRAHLTNGECFNASRCVYHFQKARFYTIIK